MSLAAMEEGKDTLRMPQLSCAGVQPRWFTFFILLLVLVQSAVAAQAHRSHRPPKLPAAHCQKAFFEGNVSAGAAYAKSLGEGLEFLLDPVPSGWLIRVVPEGGQKPALDDAELATPPYKSVNPLLVTTDYSFRSQDVVGWNPRHFQFLTTRAEVKQATAAYHLYMEHAQQAGDPRVQAAMQTLAALPEKSAQGNFQILDAHLVPGTANQAQAANLVVSHFTTTPHTLDQPADGKATPLGRVNWLRFRVALLLPADFLPVTALRASRFQCAR
ncbi:MAG: hypothetical protein ACYC46_10600 [Acidobacteriaceae bacterium]